MTLGGTAFRQAELDAAPVMMVVARLGVGFDAVEIPALNKRKIPLMTTGIANSVSVAEHAMYMLLASARLSRKHDRFVRENTWGQRLTRPAGRPRRQVDPGGRHGPHRLAHGQALRRLRDGRPCARPQHLRGRHQEGRRHQGHRPQGDPAQGRFRLGALPEGARDGEHVQHRDDRPDEARRLPGEHRARRHHQRGRALRGADQRQAARRGPRRARQGAARCQATSCSAWRT